MNHEDIIQLKELVYEKGQYSQHEVKALMRMMADESAIKSVLHVGRLKGYRVKITDGC